MLFFDRLNRKINLKTSLSCKKKLVSFEVVDHFLCSLFNTNDCRFRFD